MGKSHIGFKHSTKSKKLMSDKLKGHVVTEDAKRKMSESRKGVKYSQERKDRIKGRIAHNKGVPCDDTQKINISQTLKAKYKNGEININRYTRKVIQLTLDDEIIKIWDSIKSAQITLKIYGISLCCRGLRKTCGKFKWKYLEESI